MHRGAVVIAALWLWALPDVARADAISGPPKTCPEGAEGKTCHGPPWCAPRACASDADCKGSGRCEERSLCLGKMNCGGGWHESEPVDNVEGACAAGASCPEHSTCTPLKVCVGGASAPPTSKPTASSAGTSTEVGPSPSAVPSRPSQRSGCTCSLPGGDWDGRELALCCGLSGAALLIAARARAGRRRR